MTYALSFIVPCPPAGACLHAGAPGAARLGSPLAGARPLRRPAPQCRRRGWLLALVVAGSGGLGACSLDGLLKNNELPPNVTDPALAQTPEGALSAYHSALAALFKTVGGTSATSSFVVTTGLLSDELSGNDGTFVSGPEPISARHLEEGSSLSGEQGGELFRNLNTIRQRAGQAQGLLGDYLPDEPALRAHTFALEGYAEVMLAELYCSGIPLSTVDYNGDYTLQPGSTTVEVFRHAAALFDTAVALAGDSVRILNLARVGQGRALLGVGDYAAAAAAAAAVPDVFQYALHYMTYASQGDSTTGFGLYLGLSEHTLWRTVGVQDGEGANGLDYRSSGDPRTLSTQLSSGFYHPDKYPTTGADTLVLASGIEARLIEAEAALQTGNAAWLTVLNALRTDGTYDVTATSPPDTLWHAGTGGVDSLAPLVDPDPSAALGPTPARVDLLFRERAFWLFLTGHREGDMRRLVRQYGRPQDQVYPSGTNPYGGIYGSRIDLPIPYDERTLNPLYTGCTRG